MLLTDVKDGLVLTFGLLVEAVDAHEQQLVAGLDLMACWDSAKADLDIGGRLDEPYLPHFP